VHGRLLGGGKAEVRQTTTGLEISVPESERRPIDTVVALELDRSTLDIAAVDVAGAASLATNAKASASNTYRNQAQFGPDKAVDGRDNTRWATDAGTKSAWLEIHMGQPKTFSRAAIKQACPELKRIRKFAIECWQDEQWKTIVRGENLGAHYSVKFEPVTAQRVRLNITEATDGPTIFEFRLLAPAAPHDDH